MGFLGAPRGSREEKESRAGSGSGRDRWPGSWLEKVEPSSSRVILAQKLKS